MTLLLTVTAATLLAVVLSLRHTVRCTRRRRLVRAGASGLCCLTFAALLGAFAILSVSYLGYKRLTSEQLVSRVEFTRVAPFEYRARLMIEGERDRFFVLTGDEWQIDARLVSWKPPATILGLDPIYRLERISGRYSEVDREREETRTVHALGDAPVLDVWSVAREIPYLMPGVDAYYGTATYVPMADNAVYEVSLSRDALIARPANDAARDALGRWE